MSNSLDREANRLLKLALACKANEDWAGYRHWLAELECVYAAIREQNADIGKQAPRQSARLGTTTPDVKERQHAILQMLRQEGQLSVPALRERTGYGRHELYAAMYKLRDQGVVQCDIHHHWRLREGDAS